MASPALRIAIFTHDAYGVGHVRRSTRILRAIAERDPRAALLLITGSPVSQLLRELPPNADSIKIPTIITSGTPGTRPPALNMGLADLASFRGELTKRALELFQPDVFLVDNFPLGTRLELLPSLRELRHRRTRTVLGLRDVVDPPEKVRRDWDRDGIFDVVDRYYDSIVVYGVPEVLDAVEAYGLSPSVAQRLRYCGYVTETAGFREDIAQVRSELGVEPGFILATVGGGGDGRPMLETFIAALERFPDRSALVVPGEFMSPADRAAVRQAAASRPRAVVMDHVADLPSAMAAADIVVAMGGYNTSAEIVATRSRAVLVPRTWRSGEHSSRGKTGADAEQQVRAEGLRKMGLVTLLPDGELSAGALAAAMSEALALPRRTGGDALPDLDGASCVAEHLLALAAGNH